MPRAAAASGELPPSSEAAQSNSEALSNLQQDTRRPNGRYRARREAHVAPVVSEPDAFVLASLCDPDAETWPDDRFCDSFGEVSLSEIDIPDSWVDDAVLSEALHQRTAGEHPASLSATAVFAAQLAEQEAEGCSAAVSSSMPFTGEPALHNLQEEQAAKQVQAAAAELQGLQGLVESDLQEGSQEGSLIWGLERSSCYLQAEPLLSIPAKAMHS